jgi:predicted RNA binding protein YcfA (HicA-like mRNA interferase family)
MGQRRTVSFRDFIARVKLLGFVDVRQMGSHIRFEHADGRKTTIPDHGGKDVPVGLMNKIIRHDLEMNVDDFFAED